MISGMLAAVLVVAILLGIFWASTSVSRVHLNHKLGDIPRFDINEDWYCAVSDQEFVLIQKINQREAGRILRTLVHNIYIDSGMSTNGRTVATLEWTKADGDKRALDFYFDGPDAQARAHATIHKFKKYLAHPTKEGLA